MPSMYSAGRRIHRSAAYIIVLEAYNLQVPIDGS